MTDPYKKYRAGDTFVPSARQLNSWIDAAIATGGNLRDPRGVVPELNVGVVLVRNDTGGDIDDPHAVIGLSAPLIVPDDRDTVVYERPCFSGITPYDDRWGILLQPLPDGAIGKAIVSGISWAQVNVVSEDHDFCTAEDGTLVSDLLGCGYILWKEAGTGTKWALIRISNSVEAENDSSSGSDTESACVTIPGVDFSSLPTETDPDLILGIKDGCLVVVDVGSCNDSGSS